MIWGTPMFGNLHMGLDGWGIDYLRIRLPMNAVAVTPRSGVSRAVGVRNAHQRHVGTLIDQPSRFPLFQPISRSRWGRVVYQTRTFSSRNKTLLFWLGSWVIDHDWWRNGQGNAYAMFIAAVFFPCVGTIAHEVAMARCSCMQHLQVGMCESRWWVYLKCFHCTAAINIIIDGYYDYAYIYMIIHIQYKVYMCLNACVFTPIKSPHTHIYIYIHIHIHIFAALYMPHKDCVVLTLQDRESHGTSCSQFSGHAWRAAASCSIPQDPNFSVSLNMLYINHKKILEGVDFFEISGVATKNLSGD